MKISHNWLQEIVDTTLTPAELSDALNMLGIEVEGYEDRREWYTNFVVARVVAKEKHPKADKLSVCSVDDGSEVRTVVCGAPNVDAGQTVVLALPGAVVPRDKFVIGLRQLRGIESNGMICSKGELLLPEDGDGIWVLDDNLPLGAPIGQALGLADVIYDMSITPNRADALSHLGIARIIAAYQGTVIRKPSVTCEQSDTPVSVQVSISDHVACPRYIARHIRNVHVHPSPLWLRQRLESVGLRPRNVIVDITNLVLMECGHPLHAFDADVIHEHGIVVEHAREGERFVTLDGKERTLDNRMLMIRDAQKSLAIAGVMGGQDSAITDATRNVLIESATFAPSSIRRTARRLGINSDASYRFERGTDIDVLLYAVDRAAQLMKELAGGDIDAGTVDVYPNVIEKSPVTIRFARVRAILGMDISDDEIVRRLSNLDCTIIDRRDDAVIIRTPSYRVDLQEEIDVIEDIAIIGHYDSIPVSAGMGGVDAEYPTAFLQHPVKDLLRHTLANMGLHEIVTQNQTDPAADAMVGGRGVALANPLGEELSIMRSSSLPSMLRVVAHNLRQGADRIAFFETAKTFVRMGATVADAQREQSSGHMSEVAGILESEELCIALCGAMHPQMWYGAARESDVFDIKGVVESLGERIGCRFAFRDSESTLFTGDRVDVFCGSAKVGTLGTVNDALLKLCDCSRTVFSAILDLKVLAEIMKTQRRFVAVSSYPVVERDLAFVVAHTVTSDDVRSCILQHGGPMLRDVRLFDVFKHESLGQNAKSCAYRLRFSSHERTLTDEDIEQPIADCIRAVSQQFSASLRS